MFPWLNDVIRSEGLLDAVEDLLGPDLFCLSTGFRIKEPGTRDFVGWHQDQFYLHYEPFWVITVIAFTECTEENGCPKVVPRSHKGPILDHEDTDDPDSMLTQGQRISEPFDGASAVPIELKPGEALIFAPKMIHGSAPNRSTKRRITGVMDYCPAHAQRQGRWASATLVRGVDAYGHFEHEPRPADDFGPDARALHQRLISERNRISFVAAERGSPALD